MLPEAGSYDELVARFRWAIPERYNIGVDACDRWAHGSGRLALIHLKADGSRRDYSFDELKRLSDRLANAFAAHGLARGERLGILLPQAPETALAHLAAFKLGAISVPLFTLFGEEALEYRLGDCGARLLVTDRTGLAKVAGLRDRLPDLRTVFCIEGPEEGARSFWHELDKASEAFRPVDTAAEDPAVIIYTSGTTGQPKGALHAQRVLLGHLPGVELPHELFPKPGDRFWTPADWAWIGGLFDVLLPSLHHGVPVVAHRMAKFDPEHAFRLMAELEVRNAFMPPTALKLMRAVKEPRARFDYRLRSIGSGGETLGEELLDWGRETFDLTFNEFYGQTECNLIVANCAGLYPVKPGSMGRAVPGHAVAVVDEAGEPVADGEEGNIAVRRPDPVMFLRYWNKPEATEAKFVRDAKGDEWLLTGDRGLRDEEGYFRFVGRDDDVITSGGYRIGPGEIEDCLLRHPAVALAAAVGIPDPLRTERVKAFVVLAEGHVPSEGLAKEIQDWVKTRLAAHEYPREVEFLEALPMTATGKIIRRALRSRS
ncbi:acetyl-CoA synthetase [Tistlia consotensis]|uniref:Acetyl-CoA synthetase n=1 Tax=Tistlia consotensis USBA 355 TaxID=560819 RepID=A0A1Y6B8Z4_9PROT|nr:acyl-CoA synthetase [Tistlia consotensis]SME88035.1 acetyl-CoA synthetase [Tistlia consotensis USBA 355]SNR24404.1 acetyl-CoA synthetase [Tistlia consotensis]